MYRWLIVVLLVLPTASAIFDYEDFEGTWTIDIMDRVNFASRATGVEVEILLDQEQSSRQSVTPDWPTSAKYSDLDRTVLAWPEVGAGSFLLDFGINARTTSTNLLETGTLSRDLPEGYTELAQFIDSSESIRQTASLLKDDDELVTIVNTVNWLHRNVDIHELGSVPQASKVYAEKEADSAGITSLFVSFMRKIGYPARPVFGLANDADQNLNTHYWAEVYIGRWIPVDVVYRQVGYLDASHIKLFDSKDMEPNMFKYSGSTKPEPSTNDFNAVFTPKSGSKVRAALQVSVRPYLKRMGYGSHNILEVLITNPLRTPIITHIEPEHPSMQIISNEPVILVPENTTVMRYMIVKNHLYQDTTLIYEEPVFGRSSMFRERFKTAMEVVQNERYLTLEEAMQLVNGGYHSFPEAMPAKDIIVEELVKNFSRNEVDRLIAEGKDARDHMVFVKYSVHDAKTNTTTIFINITPKEELINLTLYESIPKCLAERVEEVASEVEFDIINADPLIMWQVGDIDKPLTISYEVLQELRDTECEDQAFTLTVAHEIGNTIGKKSTPPWVVLLFVLIPFLLIALLIILRRLHEKNKSTQDPEEEIDPAQAAYDEEHP